MKSKRICIKGKVGLQALVKNDWTFTKHLNVTINSKDKKKLLIKKSKGECHLTNYLNEYNTDIDIFVDIETDLVRMDAILKRIEVSISFGVYSFIMIRDNQPFYVEKCLELKPYVGIIDGDVELFYFMSTTFEEQKKEFYNKHGWEAFFIGENILLDKCDDEELLSELREKGAIDENKIIIENYGKY